MDFSKEMKGAFVQRRGEPGSAVLRLPLLHDLTSVDFLTISSLSAKEKAERRRVQGATLTTGISQGREWASETGSPQPPDKGLRDGGGSPDTKLPFHGLGVPRFQMPTSQPLIFLACILLRRKQQGPDTCPVI